MKSHTSFNFKKHEDYRYDLTKSSTYLNKVNLHKEENARVTN